MVKFRLEKVLAHRRAVETLAQQGMALALQQENEAQLALAEARERMVVSAVEFEAHKRLGVAPDELLRYQGQHDRLAEQLVELQTRCEEAAREVESRLAALVAASTAKQLLEKLKEKQAAEWSAELLRQENLVLDEIAIQKFQER